PPPPHPPSFPCSKGTRLRRCNQSDLHHLNYAYWAACPPASLLFSPYLRSSACNGATGSRPGEVVLFSEFPIFND
ncbi:hypothetical protein COCVIDRAFT_113117, partial [Bipolaris victoriae FI3]